MKTADVLLVLALSGIISLPGLSQQPPNAAYTMKSWHSPYDTSKIDSRFFQVITWEQLSKIKVGTPVAELKKWVSLSPFGNADALFYADTPESIPYEIELKFSPEGLVSDISYRAKQSQPITQFWPSIQVTGHEFTVPTSFRTLTADADSPAKPATDAPLSLTTGFSNQLLSGSEATWKIQHSSSPVPVTARLWKREDSMSYFKIIEPELYADGEFILIGENLADRFPENTLCKILLPAAAAIEIASQSYIRQAARRWAESGHDPMHFSRGYSISKVLASDLSSPPEVVLKTVK